MKPMPITGLDEDNSDESKGVKLVTDLDFLDCIITKTRSMLPLYRPYDLFERHELERAPFLEMVTITINYT